MNRLLAILLFVPLCLSSQTKATKVFQRPDLKIIDPLVARDEGCAKDMIKATN